MNPPSLIASCAFFATAGAAANRRRIEEALGDFIPPLLLCRCPHFWPPAVHATELFVLVVGPRVVGMRGRLLADVCGNPVSAGVTRLPNGNLITTTFGSFGAVRPSLPTGTGLPRAVQFGLRVSF